MNVYVVYAEGCNVEVHVIVVAKDKNEAIKTASQHLKTPIKINLDSDMVSPLSISHKNALRVNAYPERATLLSELKASEKENSYVIHEMMFEPFTD